MAYGTLNRDLRGINLATRNFFRYYALPKFIDAGHLIKRELQVSL